MRALSALTAAWSHPPPGAGNCARLYCALVSLISAGETAEPYTVVAVASSSITMHAPVLALVLALAYSSSAHAPLIVPAPMSSNVTSA